MRRRRFVEMAGGALAGGWVAGCGARPARRAGSGHPQAAAGRLDAAAFRDTRRSAATRFGRIAYVERGQGDAALFLHGFP
ncbi:MAG TPA: alpha/beta hydrolase, partial [Vicinamibacteria bacterium]|nr:alpha/beta hydrolase [Vicinamibacteria bacterium]